MLHSYKDKTTLITNDKTMKTHQIPLSGVFCYTRCLLFFTFFTRIGPMTNLFHTIETCHSFLRR